MKIEVDTKNRTIKLLEDIPFSELAEFMSTIKKSEEYTIVKSFEYYPYYYPYYPTTGITYTSSSTGGSFSVSNNND